MGNDADRPWVDGLTIDQVLRETIAQNRDQLAIAFHGLNWQRTWGELDTEIERAARGLIALGIDTGDHVAVWATNIPQWVILQFATARIGAVLVAVNPACRSHELTYALRQSDAKALFLVESFKSSDYLDMVRQACPELKTASDVAVHCPDFPCLQHIVLLRGSAPQWASLWNDILENGESISGERIEEIAAGLTPSDPINIQYTSGTTGLPKATMLSHRNLLMNAFYVGQRQKLDSSDRICIPVPFYHCFGCVLGNLCSAVYGSTMIIPAEFFNPTKTLEAIDRYRATVLYGVPTMFIAELQDSHLDEFDSNSLRTGIMAGAPCVEELMREVMDRLGARELTIAYGLTEASPVLTQTCTDDPLHLRIQTVGQPLPG
ncbi:MAG: AMP-binding protein, partial [Pirellulaceae bacterium]